MVTDRLVRRVYSVLFLFGRTHLANLQKAVQGTYVPMIYYLFLLTSRNQTLNFITDS